MNLEKLRQLRDFAIKTYHELMREDIATYRQAQKLPFWKRGKMMRKYDELRKEELGWLSLWGICRDLLGESIMKLEVSQCRIMNLPEEQRRLLLECITPEEVDRLADRNFGDTKFKINRWTGRVKVEDT